MRKIAYILCFLCILLCSCKKENFDFKILENTKTEIYHYQVENSFFDDYADSIVFLNLDEVELADFTIFIFDNKYIIDDSIIEETKKLLKTDTNIIIFSGNSEFIETELEYSYNFYWDISLNKEEVSGTSEYELWYSDNIELVFGYSIAKLATEFISNYMSKL